MKKILPLSIFAFLTIELFCQIPNYIPTNGLLAWYSFTGNTNDVSGNNYNGTNNGATLTTDRFGNPNSAYSFNGTSNYIDVNDATPLRLNNTDYTISFWTYINAYSTGGGTAFIYKRSAGSQNGWGLGADQGTQNKLDLITSENTDPRGYSTSTLALSGWHNVTVVYTLSANQLKFYIDGVLNNTTTGVDNNYNPVVGGMPTPSSTCTSVMRLGQDTKNNSYWLNGKLDDIGLWSRALTSTEVTGINSSVCVSADITTGLLASYSFSGNTNDVSGSGYNGTNNGATLTTDRFGNPNSAYSFNGTSNYIDVNDATPLRLNNTDYTISFWTSINAYSTGGGTAFIYKRSAGSQNGWGLGADQGTQNKLDLITSENTDPRAYSTSTLALSNWHNVTVVYTLSLHQLQFYIDGVLDNTTTGVDNNYNPVVGGMPTPSSTCTSVMRFGQDTKNNSYWLNGKLDDIKIYGRALTACDADSLFHLTNQCTGVTTSIQGGSSFCQGGNLILTANAGSSYAWSNSQTTQSITINQGGNYHVTVTDANGCTASASQPVTVNPLPTVTFSLPAFINNHATTVTLNGSPNGGSYTGVGGLSGNTLNPLQAGLGSKVITYTYTNGNNCTNTANATTVVYDTTGIVCTTYDTVTTHVTIHDTTYTSISVTDTLVINVNLTGINPPNNTNAVTVYPNPAHDHLVINNGNLSSMTGYTIKITNALGQIVFTQSVNQQQFYIDLNTFGGNGTYILYVLDAQQLVKSTKEIVLQ